MEKKENNNQTNNSISTLSTSQASFFTNRPIFLDHPLLMEVFKENSYEIFQFLEEEEIENLSKTNKFFKNICDCFLLLDYSMQSLGKLFSMSILENQNSIVAKEKKSKVREKYNFTEQRMTKFYKNSKEYFNRLKSGKKRKKEK